MKKFLIVLLSVTFMLATTGMVSADDEKDDTRATTQTEVESTTSGKTLAKTGPRFVDEDGDGICDNRHQTRQQQCHRARGGNDGSGFKRGHRGGQAACDGTGPKGARGQR